MRSLINIFVQLIVEVETAANPWSVHYRLCTVSGCTALNAYLCGSVPEIISTNYNTRDKRDKRDTHTERARLMAPTSRFTRERWSWRRDAAPVAPICSALLPFLGTRANRHPDGHFSGCGIMYVGFILGLTAAGRMAARVKWFKVDGDVGTLQPSFSTAPTFYVVISLLQQSCLLVKFPSNCSLKTKLLFLMLSILEKCRNTNELR